MEDLIKIAPNGQWTLEKARPSRQEVERMIEEFKTKQATPAAPPVAPEPISSMPQGLKPAVIGTGANPKMGKERVAALRAGFDRNNPQSVNAPKAVKPTITPEEIREKTTASAQGKLQTEQVKADDKAKTVGNRKQAWEEAVKFLARHGSKGYQALKEQMDQRKRLDEAHETGKLGEAVKPELLPPSREGSFHNEGMITSGRIKHRGIGYNDKNTGEKRFTSVPQQEKHHWRWDHQNKKWSHVKTIMGSPNIGEGKNSANIEQTNVKRAAPRSFADDRAAARAMPVDNDND